MIAAMQTFGVGFSMLHWVSSLVLVVLSASSASAVVLNVVDGQLLGASGVVVNGTAYDVQFLDGTCTDLYDGCVASGFLFPTAAEAEAASQALLDQVLLDGPLGSFDTVPGLTNGISSGATTGHVWTPYAANAFNFAGAFVFNSTETVNKPSPPPPGDFVDTSVSTVGDDTSTDDSWTFAVWTPAAPATPVPSFTGPAWLALLALLGATGAWRIKHRNGS